VPESFFVVYIILYFRVWKKPRTPHHVVVIFMGLHIFYTVTIRTIRKPIPIHQYNQYKERGSIAWKKVFRAGNDHISFPACVYIERMVSICFSERKIKT